MGSQRPFTARQSEVSPFDCASGGVNPLVDSKEVMRVQAATPSAMLKA